jgi:molybdate transport system permease protein
VTDLSPLWLSLRVASCATLWVAPVGLAVAYVLARGRFRGRWLLEALASIPLVLPPTVLGYALLVALGRRSVIGHWYESATGHTIVFTWQGAAIAAGVASFPLFVIPARVAIAGISTEILEAARLDGAGRLSLLRRIILPLARPGLAAGAALAFARALGDYGATLMVAGDTPGKTQTIPLAIYDAVMTGQSQPVALYIAITVSVSLAVTLLVNRPVNR